MLLYKPIMRILGIETSCDDTGVALYDAAQGLLSHALYSQTTTHAVYGGVVPELASRDHSQKLLPLIEKVIEDAHISIESITGIAYTAGPGLIGALMVGACFAKTLGYAWGIPAIAIHHMEGHLLAPMLEDPPPKFPFLALLISGGHTLLVEVEGVGHYKILGESLDDAVGEAFDKTAKILGLSYPGGPALAALAKLGNPKRFYFPRPMTDRSGLDFSFSGLKTYSMNTINETLKTLADKADVACAFQEAAVDTLFIKCQRAIKATKLNLLVVAGGVGANQRLREKLKELSTLMNISIYYPRIEFCTDNGAMIAYAGYRRLKMEANSDLSISVKPRWPMDTLEK